MADNNLTSSISALITQIKSEIPNANAENLKRLARSVRKLGHSGDNEIDTLINSRANALTATATTEELQTIAEAINQVDDTSNPTGATNTNADVHVSDTAPASAVSGDLWWKTDDLNLYIYYEDTDGAQWIQANSTVVAGATAGDISELTDTTNLLFDGQYSSLTGAPSDISDLTDTTNLLSSSTAGALGTLTKTFTQNEETEITLSENISPVPNVSVFKEVPQSGLTSKGNWDVNANATNYDFFDEKPISYSSATLTPSATGDGTFTSSNPILSTHQIASIIPDYGNEAGYEVALTTLFYGNTSLTDSTTPELYTFAMSPDGTKALTMQVHTSQIHKQRIHGLNVATAYSTTVADYSTSAYFDVTQGGTTSDHRTSNFGIDESGTYMYIHRKETTHQYQLSTPWDASTISYQNKTFIPSGNGIPSTTNWQAGPPNPSNNGNYILYCNGSYVARYTMSTAWDISTAGSKQEVDLSTILTAAGVTMDWSNLYNAMFSNDGTLLLVSARGNSFPRQFAYKFNLTTAFDITTAVYVEETGAHGWGYYPRFSRDNSGNTYMIGGIGDGSNTIRIAQTSTSSAFNAADVGKKVVGNSGSAIITSTAGAYTSVTPFADTSAISSWQLFGAQGKSDGTGVELSGYSTQSDIVFPTGASGSGASMVYNNNVSATFTNLRSVVFNSAGTIALVMTSGNIQRYNLSIAFDLSTLVAVTGDSFGGQLGSSQYGLGVSSDGTKLFVSDYSNDLIKQFTLSTPWSPSTQTYNGYYLLNSGGSWNSFSGGGGAPSTTNFNPFDFQFNSDGTKLLTILYDNAPYHSVAEFSLSTGWDLSTMTYVSYANFDNAGDPDSIAVSSDGLKIMLKRTGLAGTEVEVYSLPSAFSVGSAGNNLTKTAGTIELSTLTGDTNGIGMGGLIMSSDGKRMWTRQSNKFYEITGGTSSVHPYSQYSPALTNSTGQIDSSSWTDIDSMVADETKNDGDVFYAVSTDDRTSWGVIKDGEGVRKIARNNSGTWQYNNDGGTSVSTGYDLTNASYTAQAPSTFPASTRGIDMSSDGTSVIVVEHQGTSINQYNLSTAYDITTLSNTSVASISISDATPFDVRFSASGDKVFVAGNTDDKIESFSLSTNYDLSTAGSGTLSSSLSTLESTNTSPNGMAFSNDGTKMFIADAVGNDDQIFTYTMSTAWDISTLSYSSVFYITNGNTSPWESNPLAVDFSSDGTKMYIVGSATDTVIEYELSTAYDTSTASQTSYTLSVGTQETAPQAMCFGDNGQNLYIAGNNNRIYQYSTGGTTIGYGTSETWVDGTNNNEHATLQQALTSQAFNRMNKAQLDAVADPNHYVLGDTLDLMIAPYAASGTSPLSDGVTIGYQASALIKQAINGTDYEAEFPATNKVKIKSLAAQNLKIRII